MTGVVGLLGRVCTEIESQLKPNLSGLRGMIVRPYLPQVWVFKTEDEIVTVTVDEQGHASAVEGNSPQPDITIETTHEILSNALETRKRTWVSPDQYCVTAHTKKGKGAYDYLKGYLRLYVKMPTTKKGEKVKP